MVELREIVPENYEAILALHVSAEQCDFVSSAEKALAKAWVYRDTAFPFAVYADAVPVGLIMLGHYTAKNQYTVWEFFIDEKYQRLGYGGKALMLGIDWLRESFGVRDVYLGCKHENRAAEVLYESVGFQRTGAETETGFEMRLLVDEKE